MARASVGFVPWSQAAMDTAVVINFKTGWGVTWHARDDGKAEVTIADPHGEIVPLKDSVVTAEELAHLIGWASELSGLSTVADVS